MARAAAVALPVAADLGGEDVDRACDEPRRAGRMCARAATRNLRSESRQTVDIEPLEGVGHRGEAEDARPALAGALVCEVARDARRLREAARVLGQDDDRTRAERRAQRLQRGVGE